VRLLVLFCVLGASVALAADLLISPAELRSGSYRIVDLRTEDEYTKGHIPGAVRLSLRDLDSLEANRQGLPVSLDQARAVFARLGLEKKTPVVAYDDVNGRAAARLFYFLEFFGHNQVRVLDGGWKRWVAEGGAQETAAPQVAPARAKPKIKDKHFATAQRVTSKKVTVIDSRSTEEYAGQHIPGALNLDWRQVLTPDGRFKTPAELQALFESKNITRKQEAVTYCQSGVRAAALYFALRLAGYSKARVYDGSWEDWGSDPRRAVEK